MYNYQKFQSDYVGSSPNNSLSSTTVLTKAQVESLFFILSDWKSKQFLRNFSSEFL